MEFSFGKVKSKTFSSIQNRISNLTVICRFPVTFCRFAMGGLFTTNVDAEHKTFGYHKTVCGARNPAYCKCAVMCCHSFQFLFCHV